MNGIFHTISSFFFSLLILSISTHTFAQTNDKAVFKDKKAGLSFDVPAGWEADFAIDGYFLRSTSHKGYSLVLPLPVEEDQDILASLSSRELYEFQGVNLVLESDTYYSESGHLMAKMKGQMGWKDMTVYACIVQTRAKGSFVVLSGSNNEADNYYYEHISEDIAKSLKVARRSFDLLAGPN